MFCSLPHLLSRSFSASFSIAHCLLLALLLSQPSVSCSCLLTSGSFLSLLVNTLPYSGQHTGNLLTLCFSLIPSILPALSALLNLLHFHSRALKPSPELSYSAPHPLWFSLCLSLSFSPSSSSSLTHRLFLGEGRDVQNLLLRNPVSFLFFLESMECFVYASKLLTAIQSGGRRPFLGFEYSV